MRLNRLLSGLICLVLFNVLLGYSFGLWRGISGLWFLSGGDLSPVEKDWIWLQNVSGNGPATSLRDVVAKGVLPYNNSYLVAYVREKLLVFPDRSSTVSQTASSSKNYSQLGPDKIVDKLLKHRTHGFFIEASTYEGEMLSNTLFFEKERNWTGLLVEANPIRSRTRKEEKRHSYFSNTCLSRTTYAKAENFTFAHEAGGSKATGYKNKVMGSETVQCIPLATFLLALNIHHIDYFSLHVKGAGADILRQIDFRRFQIDVLSIEYAAHGQARNIAAVRLEEIRHIVLNTTLYYEVTILDHQDVIFMRNNTSA